MTTSVALPRAGDVLVLDAAASVQFSARRLRIRVISVTPSTGHPGFAWLVGYELDRSGAAVTRREVFVRLAGLSVRRT